MLTLTGAFTKAGEIRTCERYKKAFLIIITDWLGIGMLWTNTW